MTASDKQQLRALIKRYSGSGTESLIAFVAGQDGMLAACQALLDQPPGSDQAAKEWLEEECTAQKISAQAFLREVSKIVTLFHPSRDANDHYATLGLPPDAGPEEIKQAYRSLSRRYHPDTAAPEYRNQPEKFIAISRAYHALLGNSHSPEQEKPPPRAAESTWRPKKNRTVTPEQRKKVFTWTVGLLLLLVVVSTLASINYKKRAMLVGLQQSRGAFIPPAAKTESSLVSQAETPADKPEPTADTPPAPAQPTPASATQPAKKPQDQEKAPPLIKISAMTKVKLPKSTDPLPPTNAAQALPANKPPPIAVLPERSADPEPEPIPAPQPATEPATTPVPELPAEPPGESSPEPPSGQPLYQTTVVQTDLPPPDPVEPEVPDIQTRIDQFLADYSDAYQQRNLIRFSRFFLPDAEENGKPFTAMLPTYLDLFAATSRIVMKIDTSSWHLAEEVVHLKGNFQVLLQYNSGKRLDGSGPIDFVLVEKEDQFLVEKMNYVFHAD